MLFNSIEFVIFLPTVFLLYWFVFKQTIRLQNVFIVLVSYIFYGWWDWRFLSLIALSTLIDYFISHQLKNREEPKARKLLLMISLITNLSLLGFFKYYNFFLDSFAQAFTFFGKPFEYTSLRIILPVGISFYTFQTLSYTIDVYRKKLEPAKDFTAFAAFVCFFPQLVAGPIERATNLLPQFYKKRHFVYAKATDGMRQILWGLFKKVVIADNCAVYANTIFNNSEDYSGSTLFIGALFFTFQIYGDFSGYSDIAIGTARLFGFDLKQNFAFPYFSRDIAEFWRRWHMSLSTWFRDYVYIPLGGSRVSRGKQIRNTFVIFLVSGFWHGANWTFIVWGLLNALYFLPLLLSNRNRKNLETVAQDKLLPSVKECFQMGTTFALSVLAWIFFRAENVSHALHYIGSIFSKSLFELPDLSSVQHSRKIYILLVVFMIIEWLGRTDQFAIEKLGLSWKKGYRYAFYYIIMLLVFLYGNFEENEFIYFQF